MHIPVGQKLPKPLRTSNCTESKWLPRCSIFTQTFLELQGLHSKSCCLWVFPEAPADNPDEYSLKCFPATAGPSAQPGHPTWPHKLSVSPLPWDGCFGPSPFFSKRSTLSFPFTSYLTEDTGKQSDENSSSFLSVSMPSISLSFLF